MRDLLVEAGCRISIDLSQIKIKHDLLTANHIYFVANCSLVNDSGRILLLDHSRLFLIVHGAFSMTLSLVGQIQYCIADPALKHMHRIKKAMK